jgi:hypothetical protein
VRNYLLNYMLGLPDITIITYGTVVVVCIIILRYWGLKFNPKSDA